MQKFYSLLDKYSKYLLAAVIILVPLYPKFPFMRIPGTYVSIRLEDFLIGVLALAILPKIWLSLRNGVVKSMLVFLSVGFVSLLAAIFITNTIVPHIGLLHFIRRVEYFVPFFAGYLILRGERDIRGSLEFLMKCLILTSIMAFLYGAGQRYLGWPVIITQNEEYSKGIALKWVPGSHVNSTFAGHYDLASFLILSLPIFISSYFLLNGKWTRLILGAAIISGLWLLTNSVSRISVVSYLGSAVLALILLRKYKEILLVFFVSFIFFATSQPLMGRYINLKNIFSLSTASVYAQNENPQVTPKATPKPVVEDRSTSIRFDVEWPRAIRAFSKNPLLGTGYSSITLATDNDFLRLLGEVGILGFVAFIVVLVRLAETWRMALPILNKFSGVEAGFLAGVIGAFPGILLNSLFIDVFEASKFATIFWLLAGLSLFLIERRTNEQNI